MSHKRPSKSQPALLVLLVALLSVPTVYLTSRTLYEDTVRAEAPTTFVIAAPEVSERDISAVAWSAADNVFYRYVNGECEAWDGDEWISFDEWWSATHAQAAGSGTRPGKEAAGCPGGVCAAPQPAGFLGRLFGK
ncbi:MAG TPA: hypothetical protein VG713_16260 [Pirellulales bacterium]|nr:hypothetical protein [Pirellulales bacterium]